MFGSPLPTARAVALSWGLACLGACAAPQAGEPSAPPHTRWATADGSTPSPEAFEAAARACEDQVGDEDLLRGRRNRYVDWGVRMIECMNERGLTRRDAPDGG